MRVPRYFRSLMSVVALNSYLGQALLLLVTFVGMVCLSRLFVDGLRLTSEHTWEADKGAPLANALEHAADPAPQAARAPLNSHRAAAGWATPLGTVEPRSCAPPAPHTVTPRRPPAPPAALASHPHGWGRPEFFPGASILVRPLFGRRRGLSEQQLRRAADISVYTRANTTVVRVRARRARRRPPAPPRAPARRLFRKNAIQCHTVKHLGNPL